MSDGLGALTEKEKETLRLVLQGYDAKSMARRLDLSVHTINERLRHARRKLGVSSSREAARMLRESEGSLPDSLGDKPLGDAAQQAIFQHASNRKPRFPRGWIIGGLSVMTLFVVVLASLALTQSPVQGDAAPDAASAVAVDPVLEQSAREWLALLDQGRWDESYEATATIFQTLNSGETWSALSEQVRAPLGDAKSREFVEHESVKSLPNDAEVIRFRTSFANRGEMTETVSLVREDGAWKILGYWIG